MGFVHNAIGVVSALTVAMGAVLTGLFIVTPDGRERTALTVLLGALTIQAMLTTVAVAYHEDRAIWITTIYAAIVVRAIGASWLLASLMRGADELRRTRR